MQTHASTQVHTPGRPAATEPEAAYSFKVRGYDLYEKEGLKDEDHPLLPYHVTEPCIRRVWTGADQLAPAFTAAAAPGQPVPAFTAAAAPGQLAAASTVLTGSDCPGVSFSGRLIGGCLDILCMLAGTRFDHVKEFNARFGDDGIIWFLEACDLNVMSIRRALWQLDQAGWFSHVRGFLIGRPLNGEALFGLDRFEAVTGILKKYNVPILMDLDIGHIPPMMPLIEGSLADVKMCGNDLTIEMRLV